MNKLILINILKDTINAYLKNELDTDKFTEIINNQKNVPLTEDKISYNEAEVFAFIFTNIPYYKILTTLTFLNLKLKQIAKTGNLKCIADLIEAYLSDLFNSINARINTEINAHIIELLSLFYRNDKLDKDKVFKLLNRNIINPYSLASMETAEQINYEQETIFSEQKDKTALREKISRANYNKKNSVDRSITKIIERYYDENLYRRFLDELNTIFASYDKPNKEDIDMIKDEIISNLRIAYEKAQKKWNEPKMIDENQLTLNLN